MVCRLPPNFRKVMRDVAECQKRSRADSMGVAEPCVGLMRKAMASVGARYLDRGNFRHAWAFRQGNEKCVIKLANNEVKRKHNQIEADTWHQAPPRLKRYLTPVTDSDPDGLWLVMPEAEHEKLNGVLRSEIGAYIEDQLEKEGYYIADQHTGNIGLLNGLPVSIDYGFGLEPMRGRPRVGQPRTEKLRFDQESEFSREARAFQPKYAQKVFDEEGGFFY